MLAKFSRPTVTEDKSELTPILPPGLLCRSAQHVSVGASAEMVKKIYESFSNADIPAILDNVAEDVQWSAAGTLPHGGQFQSKSDMMRYFQGMGAAWETLTVDLESVDEVGEDLAQSGTSTPCG